MDRLRALIRHPRFEQIIIGLILVNAVTLGLETSPTAMAAFGRELHLIDSVILAVFVAELLARMLVHRLAFFRDPWSLFDLAVVAIALAPASEGFAVLRALRILRVLRLVTAIPSLRRVVAGLIGALPGMGAIGLLLVIVYYVFAVIATKLFSATNPELFGTIGTSAYTLFQAMTFDDWSNGIVKPLTEKEHTLAWAFIIFFMVLSAFMVLNLFIGVVVTALDEVTGQDQGEPVHGAQLMARLDALQAEMQAVRAALDARAPR